jgi:uncharacterized protein (TIGR00251 family)
MLELQDDARGVIVPVRAHAGARRNAILGVRAGMLRVAVTAAPERGKANSAIAALLCRALGQPKSAVELVAGAASPQKRFLVIDANCDELRGRLGRLLAESGSSET